jgi:hypothetical protein
MRIEYLAETEEDHWRAEFGRDNWIFGSMKISVTPPEFAEGRPKLESMHYGYYLQPLHLSLHDREELPRKLLWALAHRKPPIDFLELTGAGLRIPHCFPTGFTLESVLRITLQELRKIPLRG